MSAVLDVRPRRLGNARRLVGRQLGAAVLLAFTGFFRIPLVSASRPMLALAALIAALPVAVVFFRLPARARACAHR